jgi:tetratricopeptide (TPR) repeat protein
VLTDLNMAIKLNPRFDDAYVNKGYIYYKRGEYSKAIEMNKKASALNPDNAIAKRLQFIYSEKKQYAEGIPFTPSTPNYMDSAARGEDIQQVFSDKHNEQYQNYLDSKQ